jgi:hypothetical protein
MTNVYNPTPERTDVPTEGHDPGHGEAPVKRAAPRRELALTQSEDEADYRELMVVLASPSDDGDEDDDASQCVAVDLKTYLSGFGGDGEGA